jgi:Carbohydrate binding module (family 6).
MKNNIKAPYHIKHTALTMLPLAAVISLSGCGGGSDSFDTATPTAPPQYQSETTAVMSGQVAYYDFENSLADASGTSMDAEVVGHTTELPGMGNIIFDGNDGIHALSAAAVFDEISGLILPGDMLAQESYTLSLWAKPTAGNTGPLFFAKSEKGTLLLNHNGLTVSGMTGHGTNGDETVTYTSDDFVIPSNEWSHIAFSVDKGFVHIYINGTRVYEGGTLTEDRFTFEDGFIMETDHFDDLFSGTYNTIAIGVTDSDEVTPFAGNIDNLRIYNYALYHGNITVLSREVTHEGPTASMAAFFTAPDITLNWTIDRFPADTISISRQAFAAGETVVLTDDDNLLPGTDTGYTDAEVPIGDNYRYNLTTTDAEGHVYTSEPTQYVRVPGDNAYSAVSASLNEASENIELSLYTENMDLGSYDILRDTDNNIADATVIATGITATDYVDAKEDDFPLGDGTPYFYWVSVTDATTAEITTSLALPAASATAAGNYIPPGTYILQELTDGFCGVDGLVESNNAGFTGAGFANTDNAEGMAIRWRINVATEGVYNLYVRYANGAGDNRWGIMTANSSELINPVDLVSTEAWTTYVEVKYVATLEAGEIDLVLTAQTGGGLGNVDYLKFEAVDDGSAPTGVACAE